MLPHIEDKEVKIIGVDELSPQLGEVVNDLNGGIPEGNFAIIQVTSSLPRHLLRHGHTISRLLQESPVIMEHFPLQERTRRKGGHKNLFVLSPNTWLAGDFDHQNPPTLRYGLFTQIEGRYNPHEVCSALGLTAGCRDLHNNLDVENLTGRVSGSVSVVLERQYLEKCQVVQFQPALVEDLKLLNTLVEYPLGSERFYVARGEAFLEGYATLLKAYGISSNLQAASLI